MNRITSDSAPAAKPVQKSSPVRYPDSMFAELDVERNVPYKEIITNDGRKIKLLLDVIMPSRDTRKDRPAIIWAHGGGMYEGSKDSPLERRIATETVKRGFVAVCINYRLSQKSCLDNENGFIEAVRNAMEDVIDAFEWLNSNSGKYSVDMGRIILGGYSAGAEIVTNLCYTAFMNKWDRSKVICVVDVAGGSLYMGNILEKSPPCLIIHGTDDRVNPVEGSRGLAEIMRQNNIDCEFIPLKGLNHYFNYNKNYLVNIGEYISKFIYKRISEACP